jgi:hypothetical protein
MPRQDADTAEIAGVRVPLLLRHAGEGERLFAMEGEQPVTLAELPLRRRRRAVAERRAWAAWVHSGSIGFSLVERDGSTELDPGTARALGFE